MPAKHPPTGLKLIREVEMDYNCCSVCHQQGYTYIGLSEGNAHRRDHQGEIEKVCSSTNDEALDAASLIAHKGRLFLIESTVESSSEVLVLGLDGKLLTSWIASCYGQYGRQISIINTDRLAVGDWREKQILNSETSSIMSEFTFSPRSDLMLRQGLMFIVLVFAVFSIISVL